MHSKTRMERKVFFQVLPRIMNFAVVLLGMFGALVAFAAEEPAAIIGQKNRIFSSDEITVKKGDTVRFVNDDYYGHNVYSETTGASFDIGLQSPGDEHDIVLEKLGIVDIRCRIHPRMQLTIIVGD